MLQKYFISAYPSKGIQTITVIEFNQPGGPYGPDGVYQSASNNSGRLYKKELCFDTLNEARNTVKPFLLSEMDKSSKKYKEHKRKADFHEKRVTKLTEVLAKVQKG